MFLGKRKGEVEYIFLKVYGIHSILLIAFLGLKKKIKKIHEDLDIGTA